MKSANRRAGRSPRALQVSATGLVVEGDSAAQRLLGFADSMLRGVGQVMLQNNSCTGLLIVIGIFWNSTLCGWAVLAGTAASTATALLLGVDRSQVRAGLYGFNGALVGIGIVYFLEPGAAAWGYVILACACATVITAALSTLLDSWKLPVLTAPFVITTLLFVLAGTQFGILHSTGAGASAAQAGTASIGVTASSLGEGLLAGVAQVFLQDNAMTGIFCALGLLISSRTACAAALAGSLAGLLVAWGLGAAEPAIRSGAFGFNSVLTAIALGGGVFVLNAASISYATLAAIAAAVVFAALSVALQPLGLAALTAPFVVVVWVFLLASPLFGRLRRSAS